MKDLSNLKMVQCPECKGIGETDEKAYGFSNGDYCVCPKCLGTGLIEVPMTNADKIRAMSDEELAEIIYRRHTCPPGKGYLDCKLSDTCDKCRTDWLQQPCEGGVKDEL